MTFDLNEVRRRMPALEHFNDHELFHQTAELTADAPDYFWTAPASTSDYHHPDCRDDRGLWAHTLMVATAVERLAPSYIAQGRVRKDDVDLARAAAILHDQRKNGDPADPSDSSVGDHDLQMGAVVRDSQLPDRVADIIDAHMGPWYAGPQPTSGLQHLVHNADMIASTENITVGVTAPIPDELDHLDLNITNH